MDKRKLLIIGLGLILVVSVLLYNLYLGYRYFVAKDVEQKWYWIFMFEPLAMLALMYYFSLIKKDKNASVPAENQSR